MAVAGPFAVVAVNRSTVVAATIAMRAIVANMAAAVVIGLALVAAFATDQCTPRCDLRRRAIVALHAAALHAALSPYRWPRSGNAVISNVAAIGDARRR